MVLWKGVDETSCGLHLANRLYDYANLLASQGCLATALNYLLTVTSDDVCCAFTSLLKCAFLNLILYLVVCFDFSAWTFGWAAEVGHSAGKCWYDGGFDQTGGLHILAVINVTSIISYCSKIQCGLIRFGKGCPGVVAIIFFYSCT